MIFIQIKIYINIIYVNITKIFESIYLFYLRFIKKKNVYKNYINIVYLNISIIKLYNTQNCA